MEKPSANVEPTINAQDDKPKKRRLTKEEKKAKKLEQKRLKALKKIEKEKQFIRDRLNREVKYSKKNYEKVKRHWLEFMNGLKSVELKKNLDVSILSFLIISGVSVKNRLLLVCDRKHGLNFTTYPIGRIITYK